MKEFVAAAIAAGIFLVFAFFKSLGSAKVEAETPPAPVRDRRRTRRRKKKNTMPVVTVVALLIACVLMAMLVGQLLFPPKPDDGEETEQVTETTPTTQSEPTEATGPDLSGIPESLLMLMEKNPETTEFVLNYPNRQELPVDLSDIDRTAGVPLFLQWDQRWGYHTYGSDVMAITGCAPTCAAMVGYYLTGDPKFTPDQMADFSYADGHYSGGTNWTFVQDGLEKLGMVTTELPLAEGVMARNLEAGNPIIINVGPGDFTTTGHYMVLVAYEDGMFRINDPNSRIKSEKLWSYETLEPQIRNLWVVKKAE